MKKFSKRIIGIGKKKVSLRQLWTEEAIVSNMKEMIVFTGKGVCCAILPTSLPPQASLLHFLVFEADILIYAASRLLSYHAGTRGTPGGEISIKH